MIGGVSYCRDDRLTSRQAAVSEARFSDADGRGDPCFGLFADRKILFGMSIRSGS